VLREYIANRILGTVDRDPITKLRDAIVFSTWSWEAFNVPERTALALKGARVLYCEIPCSRFRRRGRPLAQIEDGLHAFGPEYWGGKLTRLPLVGNLQWKMVARQILHNARTIGLDNPIFIYSHIEHMAPLLREMRANGCPLVHICMDYPETYQYELIELSDRTLVIPKGVFHKLKARFGEKIWSIPQSIHLPSMTEDPDHIPVNPPEIAMIPSPRLGYAGPIVGRANLPMLGGLIGGHPEWQFLCFGDTAHLKFQNLHALGWKRPEELRSYIASFDVGIMPYDCFIEKNLHCAPLKLFDYFLYGLPVVSTPVIPLWEYSDLIYFADTEHEFARAVSLALAEPATSPKRQRRREIAAAHSTEVLGHRLEEVLDFGSERRDA
jgi:Glycosyl transferases group 1